MLKPNNAEEGWYNGFECTIDATHPNLFHFLEALDRVLILVDARYERVNSGKPSKEKKEQSIPRHRCETAKASPVV